jgi:hypothetical protein
MRAGARLVFFLLALAAALPTAAAAAADWHSEQPTAGGLGVPSNLGQIGDVEFWSPNRGVLITAGNGGNPAGVFAYDGTGWHRYSTVCGGHEGRIAWAGPTEFWTISDQPSGQATGQHPPDHISLCHFKEGQVVASYAEPLGVPGSYLPMNAAACDGPDDCWFAGDRLPGTTNVGAFHLHWNGTSMTAVPSLTEPQPAIVDPGRAVGSLAFSGGSLYESVAVREGDSAPDEPEGEPSLFHRILAGAADPFEPLPTPPISFGSARASAEDMQAFRLTGSGDGLWAVSGSETGRGKITVLRLSGGGFEQLPLLDPGGFLTAGDRSGGAAAEPGGEAIWVGVGHLQDEPPAPARLVRIHADGSVEPPVLLPAEGEGIGRKGEAGPVACPAAEQCWMATSEGWLFHLGPDLPQDTEPAMHALIEFRPPDDSLPSVPPISVPEDNSGAGGSSAAEEELPEAIFPEGRKAPALLAKVKQRLIGHVLAISFFLRARAHVQLIARRQGEVVAKTPRYTLAKGKHEVRLHLDPKRWPTKLDLEVHRAKGGER